MPSDKPRLLFYFLHLLGVGHVHRAKRLIEGFKRHGIAVDVIYGGHDVGETFEADSVCYLPPIAAKDATYQNYVDQSGNALSQDYQQDRQHKLLSHLDTLNPDAVLIEAWPFGRRIVRHEIRAMLDRLAKREKPPLVISSIRDILQPRKPNRAEETREIVIKQLDHVLVHSDPNLITLDATYPLAHTIQEKLTYTGFVVPPVDLNETTDTYDVVVTCGGGGFGVEMLKVAVSAARKGPLSNVGWCLATGPHMAQNDVEALKREAPSNVTLVERLNNLAAHLARAKVSISQCGYNTAMDALAAGQESACKAIFIPYDTQGQVEQLQRAKLLHEVGLAHYLPQSQLTRDALNTTIEAALSHEKPNADIDFNGVENSARHIKNWLDARP